MRKQRSSLTLAAAFLTLSSLTLLAPQATAESSRSINPQPTAVAGESWLEHLARSFDETSMGKTGRLGPPDVVRQEQPGRAQFRHVSRSENGTVVLRGVDLYRMNCRGCHGETGAGAPPEINSVINPVRATSARVVMEQLKARGAEMSRADAAKLARLSRTMLLDRLHHGGQDMPAFPHLNDAEVNSLVAYLRQLAGVPGAESEQAAVRVQRRHVGEHIAKSTCHICHSAAGANPTQQQLYEGAIPPLSTLPLRTNRAEFVRKVTQGAPIMMGAPPQLLRGRMPVFYYLSEEEAEDVYLYLTSDPPYPFPVLEAGTSAGTGVGPKDDTKAGSQFVSASSVERTGAARVQLASSNDAPIATFALLLGLLATLLMGLGFWFTVCELKRLSAKEAGPALRRGANTASATRQLDPEMVA
jgi:mono/diheme cytochrome c family protein